MDSATFNLSEKKKQRDEHVFIAIDELLRESTGIRSNWLVTKWYASNRLRGTRRVKDEVDDEEDG